MITDIVFSDSSLFLMNMTSSISGGTYTGPFSDNNLYLLISTSNIHPSITQIIFSVLPVY